MAQRSARSRLKASVGQGKLARAAKRKITQARFGLGMSAGNAAHVLKRQAQSKQKSASARKKGKREGR